MHLKLSALLMCQIMFAGASVSSAAAPAAPKPPVRVGSSVKVCQLTGDVDWETGRPTAAKTLSNFGVDGTDLGYPVENGDKLVLLFGDSWLPPLGGGAAREGPPDDAVGVIARTDPPSQDDKCLELQIHANTDPKKAFVPAQVIGPIPIKQGLFNVPSGGVSVGRDLFAFFWTNHCSHPHNPLKPSPDAPLARPQANQQCPENDDRNSVGRGVMASSTDQGQTFTHVVPMPAGFVYATAFNPTPEADLPEDQQLGVFIFGAPRYRASLPYLAYAPIESVSDPSSWRFFVGNTTEGNPTWVTEAEWNNGIPRQNTTTQVAWKPPSEPEILAPNSDAERCIGEFSVTWNRPLGAWLLLYNCPGGIWARIASAPWGPWSNPTRILGGDDDVACRLVMTPEGCGSRRDFWPDRHSKGKFVAGGFYAPYVLNRYTTAAEGNGPGRSTTIFWLVSTWNPYEVTVMRTTLQSEGP
jgi:Domain of unknown function (DUF4185)